MSDTIHDECFQNRAGHNVHKLILSRVRPCCNAYKTPAFKNEQILKIKSGICLIVLLSLSFRRHAALTVYWTIKSGLPPVPEMHIGTFSVTFI